MAGKTDHSNVEWASFRLKRNSAREPICPEQRLVMCLRFLATGANFRDMRFDFFVSEATIRQVCHATCKAIHKVLTPIYVRVPSTEQEWLDIASEFWQRWNLPNCLG